MRHHQGRLNMLSEYFRYHYDKIEAVSWYRIQEMFSVSVNIHVWDHRFSGNSGNYPGSHH
jgi:hypothetical protein